ncbi:MAG: D-aminoacylase [Caldilineaceae bacterium]
MNQPYDLVIEGGTVVDGTGAAPVQAHVAIANGRIAAIGMIEPPMDTPVLDARGLVVAPGFIDIHSHSDFTLLVDPRAVSSITQGVTLEVVGNCGHGCAPIVNPELARMNIYGCQPNHHLDWRTMGEYLARLEAAQPAVNVITLVPNGNLRLAVTGLVDRPAATAEVRQMQTLLAQSLEAGAWGFSTGLEYGPEQGCSEAEIIALCRVCAEAGGLYATHTRNRAGEARETIAEAIRTSAAAGVPLQISHISVVARLVADGGWAVQQALEQVAAARQAGLDVRFDMHTRLFGTTNLSAALPPQLLEGSKTEIARRLRERSTRQAVRDYPSIINALARGDWSTMVLFHSHAHPDLRGRSLAEVSALWQMDPYDAICELLLAEIDDLHGLMILAFTYRAEDLRAAFEHPDCMVGSDATALAPDGPLANSAFHGAYTWAAWFFRHFVRERGVLTPQEAVRRLTSLPAGRLGLSDRGILTPGAWADLAIFDQATFGDRGTTLDPNQTADGMVHVVVNGTVALHNGRLTAERSGRVLRRG